jgi:hypothetical protein
LIDNLDYLTFFLRNSQSTGDLDASKYDTSFTFQRKFFEKKSGDLTLLGKDLDLLRDALIEKTTTSNK